MADSNAAIHFVHGLDYQTCSNGTSESNIYLANSSSNIHNALHFKDPNQAANNWSNDSGSKNSNSTFSDLTYNSPTKLLQPVISSSLSAQLEERSWNRSFSSAFHQVRRKGTLEDTSDMHPGYSFDPSTKTSTSCSFEPTVKMSQNFPSWGDVQDLIEASNQHTDCGTKKNRKRNEGKKRRAKTEVQIKDNKYWEKRKKNNIAAKRSRDAKREKELTKQKRAMLLQIENTRLRLELSWLQEQNKNFKQRIGILT